MVHARRDDRVAVLAYDGLTTLEFAIPTEIFGLPRPEIPRYYEMVTVAGEPGPLHAGYGLSITPDAGLEALATAGTVVVPGWRDRHERPPGAMLDALREAHARGSRLLSICSGAFVLAATGLLDGRRATTHWMYADDLRGLHPRVQVDEDVLYVDEGSIVTGAGSAAGIDACLHLVREDWGAATAATVARRMVVSPHRDGGQAQFVVHPATASVRDLGLARLMDEVLADLAAAHTVSSMAARLHLAPRTLARRFREETGTSPAEWVAAQRVLRARDLLETSELGVEQVGREVGFTSAVTFRQQFQRRVRTTPSAYRSRFAARAG